MNDKNTDKKQQGQEDRLVMRQFFFDAYNKHEKGDMLTPLEQQLSDIIAQHPEYHHILQDAEKYLDKDYEPMATSSNPFFHMALHASLMEQITTDRPAGILEVYNQLAGKSSNSHEAEHQMMTILAATLWQAQQSGETPKEEHYLKLLNDLISKN